MIFKDLCPEVGRTAVKLERSTRSRVKNPCLKAFYWTFVPTGVKSSTLQKSGAKPQTATVWCCSLTPFRAQFSEFNPNINSHVYYIVNTSSATVKLKSLRRRKSKLKQKLNRQRSNSSCPHASSILVSYRPSFDTPWTSRSPGCLGYSACRCQDRASARERCKTTGFGPNEPALTTDLLELIVAAKLLLDS